MRIIILVCTLFSLCRYASSYSNNGSCVQTKLCEPGLLIPVWSPQENIGIVMTVFRAGIYFISLCYLFLGVSIIAERFMTSIEVITSKEKEVKLRRITGEPYTVLIRIWNETVSNLTLMALGSSAPEILLSLIEIMGSNFEAGELGPGTIVGSAAFNLFVIIAVCIYSIPNGEQRKIKNNGVFWVTAIWSIFAYIWLYLIISVFSPGIIEVWEGVVTFLYFPLTVVSAYFADRYIDVYGKIFISKDKKFLNDRNSRQISGITQSETQSSLMLTRIWEDARNSNEHHQRCVELLRKIRQKNPQLTPNELEDIALSRVISEKPKSRAFYRVQTMKNITGHSMKKLKLTSNNATKEVENAARFRKENAEVFVSFDPDNYICMENVGTVRVSVKCDRSTFEQPVIVTAEYRTASRTAKEHQDFVPTSGVLRFRPGETVQEILIQIVDNDVYEEDEYFQVVLTNVRAISAGVERKEIPVQVRGSMVATILILDDDHGGIFGFQSEKFKASESCGTFTAVILRTKAARGEVSIPYKTIDGAAKAGEDYEEASGTIRFSDGQARAEIAIKIINDDQYEKNEEFYLELDDPIWHFKGELNDEAQLGKPILSPHRRCKIVIVEDREMKNFIDKILANANISLMVGTHSWKQQFRNAIAIENDIENDSCLSKTLSILTMPWRIIFATIPPTDYLNGWLCFIVAIIMIGILTAIIGDLAVHFGCTVHLKDSVTAVSFVAMGTSVPDLFSSRTAAVNDKYADSSIVNVTGSNAVNVFLGIGMAWALAAVFHAMNGTQFRVEAGNLAFSVTSFIIGSVLCIGLLQLRRFYSPGAELGGPTRCKIISVLIFILIWIVYIALSALDAYCVLPTFS